jgi:multidrug resistance efflux pump
MPSKEDIIASTIRDREGWKIRLAEAEAVLASVEPTTSALMAQREAAERTIEQAKAGIKNDTADLIALGHEAAAPAKRAEKRPAETTEKRGPGRPRKDES